MSRRRSLYGRLIGPVTLAGLAATAGHAQPRPTPRPIPRPLPGPRPLPVPAPEYCQNLTFPAGCWTYEGTAFVKVVPGLNPRNRAELSSVNNRGSGNVTSDPILLDQPYLTFQLRDAHHDGTRVELLVRDDAGPLTQPDGRYRVAAATSNLLHDDGGPGYTGRHVFDLSLLAGQVGRIRIVDETDAAALIVAGFDRTAQPPPTSWSFDPGLEGWQRLSGDAFAAQPVLGDVMEVARVAPPGFDPAALTALGGDYWNTAFPIGRVGRGWIGTFDRRDPDPAAMPSPQGDAPTGILASMPFVIDKARISLLVSGGRDATLRGDGPGATAAAVDVTAVQLGVALQIQRDGAWRDARWATGKDREMFDRVEWKVEDLRGKTARILIVDRRSDAWGHVNVDDVRFADRFQIGPTDFGVASYTRDAALDAEPQMWGYADSHLHVMSYLGFGGRMIGGTPTGPIETAIAACDGRSHGGTVDSVKVDGRKVDLPVSRKLLEVMDDMPVDDTVMLKALLRIGLDFFGADGMTAPEVALKLYPIVLAAYGVLNAQPAWWIASAHVPLPALAAPLLEPGHAIPILTALVVDLDNAKAKWMAGVGHASDGYKGERSTWDQRRAAPRGRDNPALDPWPNSFSRLHQQAHVSWLRRAHQGGLRMIVMMAVHAEIFAEAQGNLQSAEDALTKQVAAAKAMAAANASWMAIAYSSAEARKIIGAGKLAIVLGVEIGSIDKMFDARKANPYRDLATRLWRLGVRHVYPVHNTDNLFAGTAINSNLYVINNYYLNRRFYRVEDGRAHGIKATRTWIPSGISSALTIDLPGAKLPLFPFALAALEGAQATGKLRTATLNTWSVDLVDLRQKLQAAVPLYEATPAQVNAQGLTADHGFKMIDALMRKGFVIDFDHASFKTRADIIALAKQTPGGYPVASSHSDLLALHDDPNEGMLKDSELEEIYQLGGTIGPVWSLADDLTEAGARRCANSSTSFLAAWRKAVVAMHGRGMPMGTDMVGFLPAPHPRFGHNRCLPAPGAAPGAPQRDGVRYAHYGAGPTVLAVDDSDQPNPDAPAAMTKFIHLGANPPLVALTQGTRTYDVNVDGPAHVGLVPDFFQDVANQAPDHRRLLVPLFTGASGYIEMLRRAERGALMRNSVPAP